MLQLSWRTAFTFMLGERHWRTALLRGGLLLLLLPPFGWHVAMGYRMAVGLAARDGIQPLLPPFEWNCFALFSSGFRSSLIIVAYCFPSLVLFWLASLSGIASFAEYALPATLFAVGVIVLPPLAIPLLPLAYLHLFPGLSPSPSALAWCSSLLMVAIFMLPAAFINVSLTGSLLSAFRLDRAVTFIIRNLRLYCEAWAISTTATAAAFCMGPFCAWGILWSYLAILSAFNQALVKSRCNDVPPKLPLSTLVNPGSNSH